jgi:uncharacterized protein
VDLVAITGSADAPQLGGDDAVIDWAVRMRRFDADGLWDRMAQRGALKPSHIDALATQLVALHASANAAAAGGPWGSPAQVRAPVLDTLQALHSLLPDSTAQDALRRLGDWEASSFGQLEPVFAQRQQQGQVRECHGDLHLGNVTQIDGHTTLFDGLEFNAEYRFIDVMSELAFMVMDLQHHGRAELAHRLCNAYLERSGDYAAAVVLHYYMVHRALVRAKVLALRGVHDAQAREAVQRYLAVAVQASAPPPPVLMVTHGLSGSGKTTLTQSLLEALGAIRVRADVERKRLLGLPPLTRTHGATTAALYSAESTQRTYAQLLSSAQTLLQAGYPVLLDATYLQRAQRDAARALAAQLRLPFVLLHFEVDAQTLRERVRQRHDRNDDASDADLAVLAAQQRSAQPLAPDEMHSVFAVPPARATPEGELRVDWGGLRQRLATQAS